MAGKPGSSPDRRKLRCGTASLPAVRPGRASYAKVSRDRELGFVLLVMLIHYCGPANEWPVGLRIAPRLLCAVPLGDRDLQHFLRSARQASTHLGERAWPSARLYQDCLVRTLDAEYGLDDQNQDREAARYILLSIHGMLGQEVFDKFLDCAIFVLESEREAVGA